MSSGKLEEAAADDTSPLAYEDAARVPEARDHHPNSDPWAQRLLHGRSRRLTFGLTPPSSARRWRSQSAWERLFLFFFLFGSLFRAQLPVVTANLVAEMFLKDNYYLD